MALTDHLKGKKDHANRELKSPGGVIRVQSRRLLCPIELIALRPDLLLVPLIMSFLQSGPHDSKRGFLVKIQQVAVYPRSRKAALAETRTQFLTWPAREFEPGHLP